MQKQKNVKNNKHDSDKKNTRLAKRIAESGRASRRDAERLIQAGRVTVNGQIVLTPVFFVPDGWEVAVDGKPIVQEQETIIWKFHKPNGVITTKKDPQNRKTVFDFFDEKEWGRFLSVGRLDINSEGLLLFTNSGSLARKLELPSSGISRSYRVRMFGKLDNHIIDELENGISVNGIHYGPVRVIKYSQKPGASNFWVLITLCEGKNREIRKIMEHLGCSVNRLIRVAYGPFRLGNLPVGKSEKVPQRDVMKLLSELQSVCDDALAKH
ncbi:MAG: rRNA pseudouridine synthase [Holosporaceae bacterium]|nr:rRNA pseudouridine synthase [Holosporaceae bacterium]